MKLIAAVASVTLALGLWFIIRIPNLIGWLIIILSTISD